MQLFFFIKMFVRNPLLPPAIFFAAGIIIDSYLQISFTHLLILVVILIISPKYLKSKLNIENPFWGIYICFLSFLFGAAVSSYHRPVLPKQTNYKDTFLAQIVDEPQYTNNKYKCIVEILNNKDTTSPLPNKTKVLLFLKADSTQQLNLGDKIVFQTYLQIIKNNGNPAEFDFQKYMQRRYVYYTAFVEKDKWKIFQKQRGFWLKRFAIMTRNHLLSIYKRFDITGKEFGILSALTLGYKKEIDFETRQQFSNTGAMHILAVSGLHVGVVYLMLNLLLGFMEYKRNLSVIKSLIIIISLWFFALLAGLAPSVNRAALMLTLIIIGSIFRRNTSTINIVAASAIILLTINPNSLYEVGFQLSYAAVISIVVFQPIIYRILRVKNNVLDKIWSLVSVSVAAQLGTMPIGFYYFHQFPNYFFITNIFAVPLASIILYLAVFLFFTSWIPFISSLVAFVLKYSISLLIFLVDFVDKLPFSVTKNIYFTPIQIVLLYVFVTSFVFLYKTKNKKLSRLAIVSLSVFLIIDLFFNFKLASQKQLLFYNTNNNTLIHYIDNKNNYCIHTASIGNFLQNIVRNFSLTQRNNKILFINLDGLQKLSIDENVSKIYDSNQFAYDTNTLNILDNLIIIAKTKILLIDKRINFDAIEKPIAVDFVILEKNTQIDLDLLSEKINFHTLLISANNKPYYRKDIIKKLNAANIPFYDLATQGAMVVSLR